MEVLVDGLLIKAIYLRALNLSRCQLDGSMLKSLFNMFFRVWATSVPAGDLRGKYSSVSKCFTLSRCKSIMLLLILLINTFDAFDVDLISTETNQMSHAWPSIDTLILDNNPIGYRGGEVISTIIRSRPWHPMRRLSLVNCSLGVIGTTAMIDCLKTDKRLFDIDLRRNYSLQDVDVRVQSAYIDAVNGVFIRLSYVPLQTKLLFTWIMNSELVRIKKKKIKDGIFVDATAIGFDYNGMPSEVLRYILDFLSITQARQVVLESPSGRGRTRGDSFLRFFEDPLFATDRESMIRGSRWA